ncbi:MAG: hypothetical protein PHF86_08165 [Candidatus Nanoarchaeia archaeon]|nr:hypothetical protein [Candidatus Nanoarchaeia archaeon]
MKDKKDNLAIYGIEGLMSELIRDAKKDLKKSKKSEEYKLAYDWFKEDGSSKSPFSFENACLVLDLNPGYIREKIFKNII